MIASPIPSIVAGPSAQVVKAAKTAARSPHGLVNLIRLVKSLEASSGELVLDEEDLEEQAKAVTQVKKDVQNAVYAKELLEALRQGNEQSSTTASTLNDLQRSLDTLERRYTTVLALQMHSGHASIPLSKTLSRQSNTPVNPLTKTLSRQSAGSSASRPRTPIPIAHPPQAPSQLPRPPTPTQEPATTTRRRKRNVQPLDQYLRSRSEEDRQSGEAGLLPIRARPVVPSEKSSRDQLLGTGGVGMGAAQLHEELGGQLADMSHRLKLNAIHFSNSLEAEKAILETSQNTLESNLSATRSSKKHLSTVSSKGRSTTCMTLGIVILVLIIFVWTYMLIRFT